jgi:hypothetical protein
MPIIGYFVFIGGLLLTLLFAADLIASRSDQQRGHRQDRHPHQLSSESP